MHLCALSGMLYYLATVQHHFKAGLYSAEDILHSPILFTRFVGAEVLCASKCVLRLSGLMPFSCSVAAPVLCQLRYIVVMSGC